MLKHGIDVIKAVVEKLNPGQIPVITGDQPIFAILKLVQSRFPDLYGEDKVVVMMGGLQIEMAAQAQVGKLLAGSSIENILVEADVTTSGRVQSFISCSHVKRTRLIHEMLLLVLSMLQKDAYVESGDDASYEQWSERQKEDSPTFFYWDMIMRF